MFCANTTITQNKTQHVLTKHYHASTGTKSIATCVTTPNLTSEATKCISTCVDQNLLMSERTIKVFQLVLTKPTACQLGQQFISTCVDQTQPMPARTQNASQIVLTKKIPWQRGHKMYHNSCWPSPYNVRQDTKCISTRVDQALRISEITKFHLNMCCTNSTHASKHTICISTCVH